MREKIMDNVQGLVIDEEQAPELPLWDEIALADWLRHALEATFWEKAELRPFAEYRDATLRDFESDGDAEMQAAFEAPFDRQAILAYALNKINEMVCLIAPGLDCVLVKSSELAQLVEATPPEGSLPH
jgi:hypothetical protein